MIDLHVHSLFSVDSSSLIEDNVERAIEQGIKYIAITDHLDIITPHDDYKTILDIEGYFEKMRDIKARYSNRIGVLFGVEAGIQEHTGKLMKKIVDSFPYDFIIGSQHFIKEVDVVTPSLLSGENLLEQYDNYYRAMKNAVIANDFFNSLGHIDYIDRYAGTRLQRPPVEDYKHHIYPMLKIMIERGQGLEINTGGLRGGTVDYFHPRDVILQWYKELGGTVITIGSDAHRSGDVGYMTFEAARHLKNMGFDHISVFENRKEIKLDLSGELINRIKKY